MTIGYNTVSYVRVYNFKFQKILEEQPTVKDLYARAIRIINESVFKDKITPSIWIDNKVDSNTYWMSLTMQDLDDPDLSFFQRHDKEWRELVNHISSKKVTVEQPKKTK
jgi:hypothetical protein